MHLWVDPADGIPRRIEYWKAGNRFFSEELIDLERNPILKRREFALPSDAVKLPSWRLGDLLGGVGKQVTSPEATGRCPFLLMGLKPPSPGQFGVSPMPQILSFYGNKEWRVRYGPPGPEFLRPGSKAVSLEQAVEANAAVNRHWGTDRLTDPVPELGPNARTKMVVSRVYWEADGRPFMLTGIGMDFPALVALSKQLAPVQD